MSKVLATTAKEVRQDSNAPTISPDGTIVPVAYESLEARNVYRDILAYGRLMVPKSGPKCE